MPLDRELQEEEKEFVLLISGALPSSPVPWMGGWDQQVFN